MSCFFFFVCFFQMIPQHNLIYSVYSNVYQKSFLPHFCFPDSLLRCPCRSNVALKPPSVAELIKAFFLLICSQSVCYTLYWSPMSSRLSCVCEDPEAELFEKDRACSANSLKVIKKISQGKWLKLAHHRSKRRGSRY